MDVIQTLVAHQIAAFLGSLANTIHNPAMVLAHLTYVMLFASVMMRDIAWLRTLAVVSGGMKIYFQQFYSPDPIDLFWESLLIIVNLVQLAIIWIENRRQNFSERERAFLATFDPPLPNAEANALLKYGHWHQAQPGAAITQQGEPVNALIYIASGDVRIEASGRAVAKCCAGDFLGEMTWQSGAPATGTAIAETPVEYLRFERALAEPLFRKREILAFAFQTSFNRNLIAKLARANDAASSAARA